MTDDQAAAFRQLRALARPFRFRVVPDAEGWPMIPGRLGRIEIQCDGEDCHGCPVSGPALAVYTDRPRLFPKLWAIPGVRRWQTGDAEMRAVVPAEAETLALVAGVVRARRRRRPTTSPASLQNLRRPRMGTTSRPPEPVSPARP